MKAPNQKQAPKQSVHAKEILKQLNAIDWNEFDARVAAKCAPEIEAYRIARAHSEARMRSGTRFMRAAA